MRSRSRVAAICKLSLTAAAAILSAAACGESPTPVAAPSVHTMAAARSWGPETPHFNLELILRNPSGDGGTQGHVKFRQPNDNDLIIYLDVAVRGLAPNTHYQLQRTADPFDGTCTSTSWLTLGKGLTPQDVVTDDNGNATESLYRILTTPVGTKFDLRMRIVVAGTSQVVLATDCYEFTVSR